MNILGKTIKELRKEKKLTQVQLAKLTGFKQNTISNHENGNRQLDETDIRTYATALGVEPQMLFDRSAIASTETIAGYTTLDIKKMASQAMMFDGKPLSDEDKEAIQGIIEDYLRSKED